MASTDEIRADIAGDDVVALVTAAGYPCVVEQTGGGTATIYAGAMFMLDDVQRYPVIAGPGEFEGPAWTLSSFSLWEFAIGPDDDGETEPLDAYSVGARTVRDVADLIIGCLALGEPYRVMNADELDSLGFDGTSSSTPRRDMTAKEAK
jgi:hypothetical protein